MNKISRLVNFELSNNNIKSLLGKNIKIVSYDDLKNVSNIKDIFDNEQRVVLFFATETMSTGHWECLFIQDNTIIFFDSYGLAPDVAKTYVPEKLLIKLKEYPNYLTNLLDKAIDDGYDVVYNKTRYQQMKANVSTCGDWVVTRLLHRNLNGLQFQAYVNSLQKQENVANLDQAVSLYIYDLKK